MEANLSENYSERGFHGVVLYSYKIYIIRSLMSNEKIIGFAARAYYCLDVCRMQNGATEQLGNDGYCGFGNA